jgi:hypothetical protein
MLEFLRKNDGGLGAEGMDPARVARSGARLIRSLFQGLLGSASNMQVETRLKRTLPVGKEGYVQVWDFEAISASPRKARQRIPNACQTRNQPTTTTL